MRPQPTKDEVLQCQFSSWYETFRNMDTSQNGSGNRPRYKNATMKSVVIPLPSAFIDYLLSDGVRLPIGATKVSSYAPDDVDSDGWSTSDGSQTGNGNDGPEEEEEEPQRHSFPQLNEQIAESIAALGGSVLPKLNWSSPKDATWLNNGTMKCQTPGDVYLLLKSSDFVMHDVLHAFDDVKDDQPEGNRASEGERDVVSYELVLRKWCNLHPSMEFRCFVCGHELVAISQRNHAQHYPHLNEDFMTVRSHIVDFFNSTIQRTFASGMVGNYSFDCYVDKNERVWILDFNVWGVRTDALLFTWEELVKFTEGETGIEEGVHDAIGEAQCDEDPRNPNEAEALENENPEIRIVRTELEIHHDPLASYRAPIDTVDLASDARGANSFQEFMEMCERPSMNG